jgi:nucleoside-diphosphate-sugar epimerase
VALLEASKNHGVKRFIYASSVAVYGDSKKIPLKESQTPVLHHSPHALQKYTCEQFCNIFSESFGLDTVCLRYFQIFGPGQYGYSSVISTWLESMYFPKAKKAFIEGDGSQSRDFCYIDNVVNANILAMKSKNNFNGAAINIASGSKIKLNDIRTLIEKYTGRKLDLDVRPKRTGEAKDSCADINKAKELLGYAPKVEFEKGLKMTVAWFKERKI